MRNKIFGRCGEAVAFNYLIENNYKILNTNFSCKLGEIDIIAKDKEYLVFIEVKTRYSRKFGDPLEAVDERKQYKIRNIATMYLKTNRLLDTPCRFDVIAILGDSDDDIRHIENAF